MYAGGFTLDFGHMTRLPLVYADDGPLGDDRLSAINHRRDHHGNDPTIDNYSIIGIHGDPLAPTETTNGTN